MATASPSVSQREIVANAITSSLKRTHAMFHDSSMNDSFPVDPVANKIRITAKILDSYSQVALPDKVIANTAAGKQHVDEHAAATFLGEDRKQIPLLLTDNVAPTPSEQRLQRVQNTSSSVAIVPITGPSSHPSAVHQVASAIASRLKPADVPEEAAAVYQRAEAVRQQVQASSEAIAHRRAPPKFPEPVWHAPWKLMRVIAGHGGWVRSIAVDASNEWFATGSADRTIKIWDLASGTLKLTLTGHIETVRGLAISSKSPYLFSAGEDKMVKCWDLEENKVIRDYYGHFASVYAIALHPTLDLLVTGGRDKTVRVWDIRSRSAVAELKGHENAVASILTNSVDPQIVTGGFDSSIVLWDLVAGKARNILTHHSKAVRAMVNHPREFTFVSAGADSVKKWAMPEGELVHSLEGLSSIPNGIAINEDNVLVSGGDNGVLKFWDYETGYSFQNTVVKPQAGSLESEAGIFALAFDKSGSRLMTCEADKTIKVWKEDETASEATHPIDSSSWHAYCRANNRYVS
jgi:pleiotropic regulator 1